MNKKQRKKWLKRHNQYVKNSELWNFDNTICEWIVPRLKKFKEINCAYPGVAPMDTPEKWDDALDKMIRALNLPNTIRLIWTKILTILILCLILKNIESLQKSGRKK